MTVIQFSGGAADVIREIRNELKKANELKEAELRLKYGDTAYSGIREKMFEELFEGRR